MVVNVPTVMYLNDVTISAPGSIWRKSKILQHQKLERTTLCSILRLRLFIFRRGADERRRSRLSFLRPQNAAKPHFSVVKMKSETVKLNIKWSARASDFSHTLIKFQLREPGALIINQENYSKNEWDSCGTHLLNSKKMKPPLAIKKP